MCVSRPLCGGNIAAELRCGPLFFTVRARHKGFCLHTHISRSKVSLSAVAGAIKIHRYKNYKCSAAHNISALAQRERKCQVGEARR